MMGTPSVVSDYGTRSGPKKIFLIEQIVNQIFHASVRT